MVLSRPSSRSASIRAAARSFSTAACSSFRVAARVSYLSRSPIRKSRLLTSPSIRAISSRRSNSFDSINRTSDAELFGRPLVLVDAQHLVEAHLPFGREVGKVHGEGALRHADGRGEEDFKSVEASTPRCCFIHEPTCCFCSTSLNFVTGS